MKPITEIHVPISPTDIFFNQVHYLAASLRQRGGSLRHSPIIVTVGDDSEPFNIHRRLSWAHRYPIEFRWVPRRLYQKHGYYATAIERWRYEFRLPYVLLLDADMVMLRDIDSLLDRILAEPALYGVPAYGSPWGNSNLLHLKSDHEWWSEVFQRADMREPPLTCEYVGHKVIFNDSIRYCPPYFNQGVMLAPAGMVTAIGERLYEEIAVVESVVDTFYKVQVALTLAIVRQRIPWRTLSIRYNYMTFLMLSAAMPEDAANVRIAHYSSQTPWFPRDKFLTTRAAMDEWLAQSTGDPVERDCRDLFRSLQDEMAYFDSHPTVGDRIRQVFRQMGAGGYRQ